MLAVVRLRTWSIVWSLLVYFKKRNGQACGMCESKFIRSTMWPKCFKPKPKYPSYSKPRPRYRQRYVQRQPNKSSYPAHYQAPRGFVLLQGKCDAINDRLILALETANSKPRVLIPKRSLLNEIAIVGIKHSRSGCENLWINQCQWKRR